MKGETLKNEGESKEELEKDAVFFETLIAFMKAVINEQGHSLKKLFHQMPDNSNRLRNIEIPHVTIPPFDYREDKGRFILSAHYDSSTQYEFLSKFSSSSNYSCSFERSLEGGEWFGASYWICNDSMRCRKCKGKNENVMEQ